LDSDKFEREAHREIAELKARSRIRQLEAEQRQLQQTQPSRMEDMTTKQLQQPFTKSFHEDTLGTVYAVPSEVKRKP